MSRKKFIMPIEITKEGLLSFMKRTGGVSINIVA
jgi:hypothetical protein